MARGEQRSNRERKKPKKEKNKTIAAAPSQKGAAAGWQPNLDRRREPDCTRRGALIPVRPRSGKLAPIFQCLPPCEIWP